MNLKNITFRASSYGNLMTENKDSSVTENQLLEIKNLVHERDKGFNVNGNNVKWTTVKESRLKELEKKRDAPPELSKTAKSEVEKIWRFFEKGFEEVLDSKYLTKGLLNEQDGLEMISELENEFYHKNDERITKGNITGECDVWVKNLKIVKDIKCSWDLKTFMNAEFSKLYEFQGRIYMYLYDCNEFHLHYCLTDTPPYVIENEIWKQKNKYGITDDDNEMFLQLRNQIISNLTYSTNPKYVLEERVKTYKITRDLEIEKQMLSKIPLALEYYKIIKTNKI